MNINFAAFAKAIPTLNSSNEATGATCHIFAPDTSTCDACVFYYKTSEGNCALQIRNPEYTTFLQTHHPELLI